VLCANLILVQISCVMDPCCKQHCHGVQLAAVRLVPRCITAVEGNGIGGCSGGEMINDMM
jgi:hypothetical protein